MQAVERHRQEVLSCSRCFPDGENFPVVDIAKTVRAMLVGQAPGITEVTTRAPFTGPAGRRLQTWFERAGVRREEIFFSALARCFPGKAPGGGDKPPSKAMMRNCRPHLDAEFALLRPRVVIPVGGMAIKELLGITRLVDAVGLTFERDGILYVPLPHPSGASTWLNAPENKARLDRALAEFGASVAALRAGTEGRIETRTTAASDRS